MATSRMVTSPGAPSTLVILLAPPGPLAGVRDALQDWSALGLTSQFVWVEGTEWSEGRTWGTRIDAAGATSVAVEQLLAQVQCQRIRVCVLVPALRDAPAVSPDLEDKVAQLADTQGGSAAVERLRLTVVRPRSGPGCGQPAREGWHNLVLSPEDATGPGRGHEVLEPSVDAIDIGPHAAAVVCGVAGLWAGIDAGPLDGQRPWPGETVRVVRSFYRRLDAGRVEALLREGVVSMAAGLPRPRTGGTRSVYVDDVELAGADLAEAFWRKHAAVLKTTPAAAPSTSSKELGAWEALKMLGSFLVAVVKNAPAAWYARVMYKVASAAATALQKSIYGEAPSSYAVLVKGVRGDGQPADWRDMAQASAELGDVVARAGDGSTHAGRDDLTDLWRDFAGAAFTLADAGTHVAGVVPVQIGIDRGVVRRPADVAPGAEAAFTEIPPFLLDEAGYAELRPADVLGTHIVKRRLQRLAARSDSGLDEDHTLNAIDSWAQGHRDSFVVQVAETLGHAIVSNAAEVRRLLDELATAGSQPQVDGELERKQRRLAIVMRVLFAVFAVAEVVIVVLGVRDTITASTAVISGLVTLVLWFGATFGVFLNQQRALFQDRHRRRVASEQAEVNQKNLGYALQDLRRTTQAYSQLLEWSRVVAVMVSRPFGQPQALQTEAQVVDDGMPLCTRLGVAKPHEDVVAQAVQLLRRDRYRFGWLGPMWDRVLADAPRRLGAEAMDLAEDPARMYAEVGGPEHFLTRWADLLEAGGPGTVAGAMLWQEVLEALQGEELAATLVSDVRISSAGATTDFEHFMSDVGLSDVGSEVGRSGVGRSGVGRSGIGRSGVGGSDDRRPQQFDREVFSANARISGSATVVETWSRRADVDGLGKSAVTVQLSDGMPAYDLAWAAEAAPAPNPDRPGSNHLDQTF